MPYSTMVSHSSTSSLPATLDSISGNVVAPLLQDAHGKAVDGQGGEPHAEVLVRLGEPLEDLLQRLEPRLQQVAVLQDHPVAALVAHLDVLRRHGALQ